MKRSFFIILILTSMVLISCSPPNLYRSGWMFSGYSRNRIVRTAKRYLGVIYKYGGSSPRGFDCSGYVKYVYKRNGMSLPRSASRQYYSGRKVSLRRAMPGDLVFFKTSSRRISHVGIYLGNFRFIHAPRSGKRVSYADMKKSYWKKRYIGSVSFIKSKREGFGVIRPR